MAGASWEHALIKDNLAREAGFQLKNSPCRVVTSDLRVKVSASGCTHIRASPSSAIRRSSKTR